MSRPRASRTSRTRSGGSATCTWPASTRSGAAAWPGPWSPAPSSCNPTNTCAGIADSKVLTAAERERLFGDIVGAAVAWHVAIIEPDEIDRINIHRASLKAMREAIMALVPLPGFVLVDGFRIPDLLMPQRPIDRRRPAVDRHRRRIDPGQSHARSHHGGPARATTRDTASIATRATRPATIWMRSAASDTPPASPLVQAALSV